MGLLKVENLAIGSERALITPFARKTSRVEATTGPVSEAIALTQARHHDRKDENKGTISKRLKAVETDRNSQFSAQRIHVKFEDYKPNAHVRDRPCTAAAEVMRNKEGKPLFK